MLFDLKDVFASDGAHREVQYTFSLSDTEVAGGHPFTSPVEVSAAAGNKAGMVTLTLEVGFEYSTVCDRCCEPLSRRMNYTFTHRLIGELEEDFNDDYIETPEFAIELDELVTSDILLELPSKFLCRGDCQGLCQKCGHNLNLGDCDCDKQPVDPRLEALKSLLD